MPVMADPTQLEVAVLNLAINARDAMPEGGELSFSTRPVAIGNESDLQDGDYIELTISDTGSGMPAEVAERAFEPFFTTKEVGKGTGLGLSMVYGMAVQSGGAARIRSAPGKGTSVTLLFRQAEGAIGDAIAGIDEPSGSIVPLAPVSILVVDDDPDVRDFIVNSLQEQGYRVREASDGRRGWPRSSGRHPILSFSTSLCPACPAPMSRSRSGPSGRSSQSCSSPATAKPTRSSK